MFRRMNAVNILSDLLSLQKVDLFTDCQSKNPLKETALETRKNPAHKGSCSIAWSCTLQNLKAMEQSLYYGFTRITDIFSTCSESRK